MDNAHLLCHHDILISKIEDELKRFKSNVTRRSPSDIYDSWYKIGFFEEFHEMLACDYSDELLSDEIFEWLASNDDPLNYLYNIWLDCDGAFNHDWDAMIDWIETIYEERDF